MAPKRVSVKSPKVKTPSARTARKQGEASPDTPEKGTAPVVADTKAVEPLAVFEHARQGALSWDEYFMSVAFLSAMRSKDPSTQVGAVVVNEENRIVGIGYNGFPKGIRDSDLSWARSGPYLDTKYPYVCHAEMNAILNKNEANVNGCRLYVSLFPCDACAKIAVQSGIKQILYASDKHHDTDTTKASKRILELAGVATRQLRVSRPVHLNFDA
eukprot:CAMPEP_0204273482 /NCGR_PEP_ID=MMETSP0468-20130131/23493_1 /ASSEMBLY_ACC=CAM_ASM_000383 /TAXON_ID=2969 /ORGANISM="Oxyrrhis marina" /LENGTH=213 /DNA_ID=CAMNT_0051249519 /DNA_START=25 /DNA_END=666 /DNA_ORIENTATION=+